MRNLGSPLKEPRSEAGTPFVSPAHGAFPEIAASSGGGLLVASADPEPVAETLRTLVRDRVQLRELAAAGLAGVHREYSLRRSAERAVEIYNALL